MKFFGNPNEYVNTHKKINGTFKTIPLFRFDSNGEYETFDINLIEKLKFHFKYEEKTYKCKKCEYETANKGELLAHYKTHKEE